MQSRRSGIKAARRRASLARARLRLASARQAPPATQPVTRKSAQRAQSVVEFALTLPVLMLFLLTAIDLGRVFIGYVNMQNMVRIATNFASTNPTAWADGNTALTTRYRNQVLDDAQSTGCALPTSAGTTVVPVPTFPSGTSVGDTAKVTISCKFHLIAPYWQWVGIFPGGNLTVTTSAEFPIRTGMTGTSSAPGQKPVADFDIYNSSGVAQSTFFTNDTVYFRDQSGYLPTAWDWCFNWDVNTDTCATGAASSEQDPTFVYTTAGHYTVRLVVSNLAGTSDPVVSGGQSGSHVLPYVTINVPNVVPDFAGTPTTASHPPSTVSFTDQTVASPAITSWSWDFGDPSSGVSNTSTLQNPTHVYSNSGTYTVTLTVTNAYGTYSTNKVAYVTIGSNVGMCQVPNLVGQRHDSAPTIWTNAGFSGSLTDVPKAPKSNYTIGYQSIAGLSWVSCTSAIQIGKTAP